MFIDQKKLESIFYQVLVIFNNYFHEQKVSAIFSKIKSVCHGGGERRVDNDGHGYGGGTAAAASAMAEGSEGERQGEWTCPGGSVRDVEVVQASRAARGISGDRG